MAVFRTNKVYTFNYSGALAKSVNGVASSMSPDFWVDNYNHTLRLKSVLFGLKLTNDNARRVDFENSEVIDYMLTIGEQANVLIASPIIRITNPQAGTITNGLGFNMYKTGQLFFDSFYIRESFKVKFTCLSWDADILYQVKASIVLEIEELTE